MFPLIAFTATQSFHIRNRFNTAIYASNSNEILPMRQGSSCAIITPMTSDGAIDIPSLRNLLQLHVASGTDNLCVLGTTGEASMLTMDERAQVLQVAVEEVKGEIPILAGTGTINPVHVKEMTVQAIDIGCDASLVVTPYYVKPPQRGLIKHFSDMADIGLPVVMYNIPGRTKVDLSPESTAILGEHPKIIGLKDATGDLDRVEKIRSLVGDKSHLLLFSGEDGSSPEFVMRGGDGCISVTANVAPKEVHDLMKASLSRDTKLVEKINEPLLGLHKNLFLECECCLVQMLQGITSVTHAAKCSFNAIANPIPVKWALFRMGLIKSPYCRPPLAHLDSKFYNDVEAALQGAELLGPDILGDMEQKAVRK